MRLSPSPEGGSAKEEKDSDDEPNVSSSRLGRREVNPAEWGAVRTVIRFGKFPQPIRVRAGVLVRPLRPLMDQIRVVSLGDGVPFAVARHGRTSGNPVDHSFPVTLGIGYVLAVAKDALPIEALSAFVANPPVSVWHVQNPFQAYTRR